MMQFRAGALVGEYHDASRCTFDGRTWFVASICLGSKILDTNEGADPAALERWVRDQLRQRTGVEPVLEVPP